MQMKSWSSSNGKEVKFVLVMERKHVVDIGLMHGGH